MDTQFQVAIFQLLDMDGVIQVLGIRSIDGEGDFLPQVQTACHIGLRWSIWHLIRLCQDSLWKG